MVRAKLKTPEGRKFLLALLVVFMIAAACVGRATIVGVVEQYNIPLSAWTTSMYVLQSAMIFVYSLVFTVLLAIPLGIFFLGGRVWVVGGVSMLMDISSEIIHSLLPLFMVTTLGASVIFIGLIEGLAEATALFIK
ncbi:hypothetical protein ID866_8095, partial [Astraeus odoratus]